MHHSDAREHTARTDLPGFGCEPTELVRIRRHLQSDLVVERHERFRSELQRLLEVDESFVVRVLHRREVTLVRLRRQTAATTEKAERRAMGAARQIWRE